MSICSCKFPWDVSLLMLTVGMVFACWKLMRFRVSLSANLGYFWLVSIWFFYRVICLILLIRFHSKYVWFTLLFHMLIYFYLVAWETFLESIPDSILSLHFGRAMKARKIFVKSTHIGETCQIRTPWRLKDLKNWIRDLFYLFLFFFAFLFVWA